VAEVVSDEKVGEPEQKARPQRRVGPFHPHDETKLLRRFGIAYFLLAALVGAGVGFLIVAVGRSHHKGQPSGPAFQAATYSGISGARQIADAVSKQYRLPSGDYLLAVAYAGTPKVQNVITGEGNQPQDVRISAIIVRGTGVRGEKTLSVVDTANSVMYGLCGLASTDCSIGVGKPSIPRAQLIRREALELGIDTFKQLPGFNSVLEVLPHSPNTQFYQAIFFRRSDLAKQIDQPLSATLPPHKKLVPGVLGPGEVDEIVALTRPRLFEFSPRQDFSQLVDGSYALFITPATTS
jgi:hypothetical protein